MRVPAEHRPRGIAKSQDPVVSSRHFGPEKQLHSFDGRLFGDLEEAVLNPLQISIIAEPSVDRSGAGTPAGVRHRGLVVAQNGPDHRAWIGTDAVRSCFVLLPGESAQLRIV